jgi:protein-tyrosine phosphatase
MPSFIELEGTCNTRDIGDIRTEYKRKIKPGILYRSDKLSYATNDDYNKLRSYGIKNIIDLRSDNEKRREPNIVPTDFNYIEIPISIDKKMINEMKLNLSYSRFNNIENIMKRCNRDFVVKHAKDFAKVLNKILEIKAPILFHCSFGKDRTGFVTALIYYICSVPKDEIYYEYLLSNKYIKQNIENEYTHLKNILNIEFEKIENIYPILLVKHEYLHESFNSAKNIFGSFSTFIREKMNFNDSKQYKLREFLLE